MRSLIRKPRARKQKDRGQGVRGESKQGSREALERLPEMSARVELIQALIPLGLKAVEDILQEEVRQLAGERYSRKEAESPHRRWGSQPGSVYLADQKLTVDLPRVRDLQRGQEIQLQSYERLQQPRNMDEGLMRRIVSGLSCRNYRDCAEAVPEAFGLSASSVSRRTIRATERKLAQLQERRLEAHDFVVVDLPEWNDRGPWLASLYVTETDRGKGIGRRLVQRAVADAAELGVEKMYLFTVGQDAFFQHLGWSVEERVQYSGKQGAILSIMPTTRQ